MPDLLSLRTVEAGGKAALARALARIEKAPDDSDVVDLLSEAYAAPRGLVAGLTGPPGVGKSTLMNALISGWRGRGRRVACIAVDPSSRRSGGALLGDRTRLSTDPEDQGVFVRSMAARDRLGGLAELTTSAMVLMRALYDVVLIETVGVGQSETDIAGVADTVVLCVQPGSGDSLQYMKAGIAEIPHVVVVTKADMGAAALRARADVVGALSLGEASADDDWEVPVLLLSALDGKGGETLIDAVESHVDHRRARNDLTKIRKEQAVRWLTEAIRGRYGRDGIRRAGYLGLDGTDSPFRRLAEVSRRLSQQ